MRYPIILENKCKTCKCNIVAKRSRDLTKEFCSPGCVGKYFKTKEKEYTNCLTCNLDFKKTCKTENMYCSTKCYHSSQIVTHFRNCERCGKEFILKNIAYEKRGAGRFCSRECGAQTYNWDESYFEKINTEQKAYWFGFIFADGCINKTEFRLHLSIKDMEHLKKFAIHLKSNHPIHHCQKNTISFNIGNKKIIKDLKNLNITEKKTFTIEYPNLLQLPHKLNKHFIRGFFDGDGCLYIRKDGLKVWNIYSASENFKNQLVIKIKEETGIVIKTYKQKNGWNMVINKKDDIEKIGKYMYKDATIFLERKKEKF